MHINADTKLSELSDTHKYGINDGSEISGKVLVSVPIKYVEEQVSDTLPKLTPTHKHIEMAREENRADGDARDQVKCGTWKKIERKTAVSMQLDPRSERKPRSKNVNTMTRPLRNQNRRRRERRNGFGVWPVT